MHLCDVSCVILQVVKDAWCLLVENTCTLTDNANGACCTVQLLVSSALVL